MPNRRTPRRHEFLFSPRDYLNDPVVLGMGALARGVYSTLLFALWEMDEPGVCVADPVVLAALARCTAEEWGMVEGQVERGFDVETRPGWWVQKRLVYEHGRQSGYVERQRESGRLGSQSRWAQDRVPYGKPMATLKAAYGDPVADTPCYSMLPHVVPESKETPLSTGVDVNGDVPDKTTVIEAILGGASVKAPARVEWEEGFRVDFWRIFPRKVGKPGALKAWHRLMPEKVADQPEALEQICTGVERWIEYWKEHETHEDKIPHPATFLNDHRHEDFPS